MRKHLAEKPRAGVGLFVGRLALRLAGLVVAFGLIVAWGAAIASANSPDVAAPIEAATGVATPEVGESIPTKSLWGIIRSGGVLMIPLGMCSLALVAFAFERAISLRYGRVIPRPFVRRFLEQMRGGEIDRQQAISLCEENGSPVAEVFGGAVRKWGCPAVEVEQAILDAGERVTNSLRRYFRVLNAVATISPLLGLLGTVFGMITSFNAIATSEALGKAELLAAGISQALLTTAAGLCIAIPALIIYLYYAGRVDRLIMDIDALGQELVPLVCAEEMGSRTKAPSRGARSRRTSSEAA